jgi:hypothetical protein
LETLRKNTEAMNLESEQYRDEMLRGIQAGYTIEKQRLTQELAKAKAMVEQHARSESTREFIGRLKTEVESLEQESENLTVALERIDQTKQGLLEDLPIEGLEIRDGEIFLDGIPFDRVNESRRVRLAIEIAKMRAGDLGLITVDGLENLDSKTFSEFRRQALESGLQMIIAKVSDDPELTIRKEEAIS